MKLRNKTIIIAIISSLIATISIGSIVIKRNDDNVNKNKIVNYVSPTNTVTSSAVNTTNSAITGASITSGSTVNDLKSEYGFVDNFVSTVYGVDSSTKFKISFKNKEVPSNAIDVYTDMSLDDKYKVEINVENTNGDMTISPKKCAMVASGKKNKSDYNYWGDASTYYIVCRYDINSENLKKLQEPMVIPFTVKNKVSTPVLTYDITDKGKLKLVWNKVDGVTGYKVYKTSADGDQQYPVLQAKVSGDTTEWCDWLLDKNNGVYKSKDKKNILMQNAGLSGVYSITAYNKDGESKFSNKINISSLGEVLPVKINNKTLTSGKVVKGISSLPAKVEVENIDGSKNKFDVQYKIDKKTKYKNTVYYKYQIKHTYLSGYVKVKIEKGSKIHNTIDNGLTISVGDKIEYINNTKSFDKDYMEYSLEESKQSVQDKALEIEKAKTVVNNAPDIKKNNTSNEESLVVDINKHLDANNKKANRDCNEQEFKSTKDVYFNTIYEQYIATQILNLNTKINIRGFNKLAQVEFLDDVMQKVLYQNPKLNIVKNYSYDAESGNLNIEYKYSDKDIKANMKKVDTKIKQICKGSESLSEQDKAAKIYNYISSNIKYDKQALKSLERNKYRSIDKRYDKSESIYGALLNGKALGKGYADTFKACCDYLGVECKVVSGYMYKTIPHTWNIVKIDGEWLNIDCTNNAINTGINKFVYLASYDTLKLMKYSFSNQFEIDADINKFKSKDNSKEFYAVNGLVAKNLKDYEKIIEQQLRKNSKQIVVRYLGNDEDYSKISSGIVKVFKKVKQEKKISKINFGFGDGYYVLWFKR